MMLMSTLSKYFCNHVNCKYFVLTIDFIDSLLVLFWAYNHDFNKIEVYFSPSLKNTRISVYVWFCVVSSKKGND